MKLLGLLGGTTSFSTAEYYRTLNQLANQKLGGVEAAKLVLWSLNFGDLQRNNLANDQESNFELILDGCLKLQSVGAEAVLICANTLHLFADRIQEKLDIPLINLVDEVARVAQEKGLKKLLLLGTKSTMELPFYTEKLSQFGIEVILPNAENRDFIHQTIYEEMAIGNFRPETRKRYLKIIKEAVLEHADGVILGCTEIPILLGDIDCGVPILDTMLIHSNAAIRFSLQ